MVSTQLAKAAGKNVEFVLGFSQASVSHSSVDAHVLLTDPNCCRLTT